MEPTQQQRNPSSDTTWSSPSLMESQRRVRGSSLMTSCSFSTRYSRRALNHRLSTCSGSVCLRMPSPPVLTTLILCWPWPGSTTRMASPSRTSRLLKRLVSRVCNKSQWAFCSWDIVLSGAPARVFSDPTTLSTSATLSSIRETWASLSTNLSRPTTGTRSRTLSSMRTSSETLTSWIYVV